MISYKFDKHSKKKYTDSYFLLYPINDLNSVLNFYFSVYIFKKKFYVIVRFVNFYSISYFCSKSSFCSNLIQI